MRAGVDVFLFLGQCLAVDDSDAAVAALRNAIAANEGSWLEVVALANDHLVTPTLFESLQRKGVSDALPPDLRSYLAEIHGMNARRNATIRRDALEVTRQLNRQGIVPAVLKGALQLFERHGGDGRMMADIDLLVPRPAFTAAIDALTRIGYVAVSGMDGRPAHGVTLARAGGLATIDLHRDLGPQRSVLSAEAVLASAVSLSANWLRLLAPSPAHRVLHNIVNTAVAGPNHRLGVISLRQLHDLAVTSHRHAEAIDWVAIRGTMGQQGLAHVVDATLCLAHRLLALPMPRSLDETPRARLHFQRCLLQLRSAPLALAARYWTGLTQPLSRVNMEYVCDCDVGAIDLNLSRARRVWSVLRRGSAKKIRYDFQVR
ncbi:nucleotidyltransferase domain-containing protein [Rhodospirillaceae bacterium SYSU D60014]|uniref:nucleotidyltransferase domain-containing protein n=1 Tax=Virgifigura deserti TaxID=2268457 RepID=UPI000E672579